MSALFVAAATTSMYAAGEKAQGTGWGVCRNPIIKNGGGVTGTYDWSGRTHGGDGCESGKKSSGTADVTGKICETAYSALNDENKEAKFVLTTKADGRIKTNKSYTYILKVSKDRNFNTFSSYNLTPNACKNNNGKVNDQSVSGTLGAGEEVFAAVEAVPCNDQVTQEAPCPEISVKFDLKYDDDKTSGNFLPLGIIGAPNTLQCKEGVASDVEVYSSNGVKVDIENKKTNDTDGSISFIVPNKEGITYDNLKVKLVCSQIQCNNGKGNDKGNCGNGQWKKNR